MPRIMVCNISEMIVERFGRPFMDTSVRFGHLQLSAKAQWLESFGKVEESALPLWHPSGQPATGASVFSLKESDVVSVGPVAPVVPSKVICYRACVGFCKR